MYPSLHWIVSILIDDVLVNLIAVGGGLFPVFMEIQLFYIGVYQFGV